MSDKSYYVTFATRQPLQVLSLVPPDLQRSSSLPNTLTLRLSPLQRFELSRRSHTLAEAETLALGAVNASWTA